MEFVSNEVQHGDAYVNQREYRIVGMSRSGNHAIINWIFQQSEGRTCFLNCVEGKMNPFRSARPRHNGNVYKVNYADFDLEAERAGHFSSKDTLIYNYEDSFLGPVFHPTYEIQHDEFVGRTRQRFDLLILRDPFNLFASRLRSGICGHSPLVDVRIWKQHAREFLGQRSHLRYNRTLINYNTWYTDTAYRRRLTEKLGLRFTDAGIDQVPRTGDGSSFDGRQFDGQARRMRVLERWKHYQDNPAYRRVIQDEQLLYLARTIFGEIRDTERLHAYMERTAA